MLVSIESQFELDHGISMLFVHGVPLVAFEELTDFCQLLRALVMLAWQLQRAFWAAAIHKTLRLYVSRLLCQPVETLLFKLLDDTFVCKMGDRQTLLGCECFYSPCLVL